MTSPGAVTLLASEISASLYYAGLSPKNTVADKLTTNDVWILGNAKELAAIAAESKTLTAEDIDSVLKRSEELSTFTRQVIINRLDSASLRQCLNIG